MDVVVEGACIVSVAPHRDDQHRGTVHRRVERHRAARSSKATHIS
jgi:hypothetical protein